jgi:hypothetical protein
MKSILLSTLLLPSVVSASPLEPVGKPIRLPFPNDQSILGVGGLGYDSRHDLWSASSENIASASNENGASSNYDVSVSVTHATSCSRNFCFALNTKALSHPPSFCQNSFRVSII